MQEQKIMSISKKVGARTLTESEIALILPTYSKIKTQIDEIRAENENTKSNEKDDDQFTEIIQKTNNIGILGARGTGKTSVIKTLMKYLIQENNKEMKKNIILPLIVPENMSESINLMATILGLFKKEVDVIQKKYNEKYLECWEQRKLEVVNQYNELVKKYCYIQNEYRQIIVGQYTTENDYVKRSSEIFNSDIEFINCLNRFIAVLLKEGSYSDNALIFLFVDDIDLSTHRCTDVVKTLLSYISHPKIVTFLSGDLDTFEEALTIDFLRQEKALSKDLLEQNFLDENENNELLKRKKVLSYEYLKKVIPPVYRHNVKRWALEDRGNFLVMDDTSQAEDSAKSNPKLVDLLNETFKGFECECFFQYCDFSDMKPKPEARKEEPNLKMIPQVFCLFDSTSRGLNNVYNALIDTKNEMETKPNENYFPAIKLFLETVVASNAKLNEYRALLFETIIQFGSSFKTTTIRCDNFKNSVYVTDNDKTKPNYNITKPEIRFTLFVFLDFAMRILKHTSQFGTENYKEVRQLAVCDLINYPVISGSTMTFSQPKIQISDIQNLYQNKKERSEKSEININDMEKGFLILSDFTVTLNYYQYFCERKRDSDLQEIALSAYYLFKSRAELCSRNVSVVISEEMNVFQEQFESLLILFGGGDAHSNVIERIFNKISIIDYVNNDYSHFQVRSANKLLYNSFARFYGPKLLENNRVKPLIDLKGEYLDLFKEDTNMNKKISAIIAIDKNNLWKNELSDNAKNYIKMELGDLLRKFLTNEVKSRISLLEDPYKEFINIKNMGSSSDTKAKRLKEFFVREGFNANIKELVLLDNYLDIIEKVNRLAFSRAWYGVKEANKMFSALRKAWIENFENEDLVHNRNELQMWLHCYACYTVSDLDLDKIYKQSSDVAEFSEELDNAFIISNVDSINNYITHLREDLDESVLNDFDSIFE